jgi:hypothetical protein
MPSGRYLLTEKKYVKHMGRRKVLAAETVAMKHRDLLQNWSRVDSVLISGALWSVSALNRKQICKMYRKKKVPATEMVVKHRDLYSNHGTIIQCFQDGWSSLDA